MMNISNISATSSSINKEPRSCKYHEPSTAIEGTVKRTVLILMCELGIASNIFIIILAVKYTVRKNLHHLIINMAVSDSLFLFMKLLTQINILPNYKWSIYPSGKMGDAMCKLTTFILHTSYPVSLFTLLVITIERFRATRRTLQRLKPYTLKKRMAVLGVCWLIPMIGAAGELPSAKIYGKHCNAVPDKELNVFVSTISIPRSILTVLLCCVIFVLSILTIRRLSRPNPMQAHVNQEQQKIRASRVKAAVRMVLASTLLYVCCWLGQLLAKMVLTFDDIYDFIPKHLMVCIDVRSFNFIVMQFLTILNALLSPCIYIMFMSDFREAAKKFFAKKVIESIEKKQREHVSPDQNLLSKDEQC